jgi:hypothetical protein
MEEILQVPDILEPVIEVLPEAPRDDDVAINQHQDLDEEPVQSGSGKQSIPADPYEAREIPGPVSRRGSIYEAESRGHCGPSSIAAVVSMLKKQRITRQQVREQVRESQRRMGFNVSNEPKDCWYEDDDLVAAALEFNHVIFFSL